jgi:predicted nucleic-acid-binding protein
VVAADTNVLLRRIVLDGSVLSAEAERWYAGLADGGALIDRLILAEFRYVMSSAYGFTKSEIAETLQAIVSDRKFVITDRPQTLLALDVFASERPLSFEDCWLLMLHRAKVVDGIKTFDKALARRAD